MVSLVLWVHQELMELLDLPEVLELQEPQVLLEQVEDQGPQALMERRVLPVPVEL